MSDLREANYHSLIRQFFDESGAKKAARRIDGATTARKRLALTHLLRHHDDEDYGVTDEETWKRDDVDELLHFYSIMEIASLLDLIPSELPSEFRKASSRRLGHPAVSQYFVSSYALVLPQLFLLRLGGYVSMRLPSDTQLFPEWTFPLFLQLLHLDSMIHGGDENVDTILWFLDGGSLDDYDIDDTISALTSAKTFLRCLSADPEDMTPQDSSIQGLVTFLDFCTELDSFLGHPGLPELLRYEAWHLYGYWFGHLRSTMGEYLNAVVDRLATWKVQQGVSSAREKKIAVAKMRRAVERLLSGDYGRLPVVLESKMGGSSSQMPKLDTLVEVDEADRSSASNEESSA
jgi:hypothetical protein